MIHADPASTNIRVSAIGQPPVRATLRQPDDSGQAPVAAAAGPPYYLSWPRVWSRLGARALVEFGDDPPLLHSCQAQKSYAAHVLRSWAWRRERRSAIGYPLTGWIATAETDAAFAEWGLRRYG